MFNLGAKPGVRGFGHIFLQVLRLLTIITLLTTMASNWAMIIVSGLEDRFAFFDTVSHIFASTIALCLIISELDMIGILKRYFERNWPVLSPTHSLAWLGLAMVMLGCQLISDQGKEAYSKKIFGMPLWRLVLSSGILAITFGFSNILSSLIFRDGKGGITARQIRSDGNLAQPTSAKDDIYEEYSQRSASVRQKENISAARRVTRMLNVKNFRRSKIQISKPIMHPTDADLEHGDSGRDDRASPIMPNVQRPPTVMHPAYTGGSRYSEAHMSRF
ncbi:hypothetical protein QBC33DRAFT_21775 [Phialemonium atrogriseum]|uniref:DUF7598 domain-containing protein n=1 Tax=Phialemonium atrogriseum TaxID=1093897 RepID=A0AAJ0FRP4_9PEZI|nr:uncharacterized protein QBC33DRAFT_21775 [Phialemonium atrogriseum]KAK1772634.1 hypothetical protein QBC33DRAFT_21775 [Phialemonium atrogriseum]